MGVHDDVQSLISRYVVSQTIAAADGGPAAPTSPRRIPNRTDISTATMIALPSIRRPAPIRPLDPRADRRRASLYRARPNAGSGIDTVVSADDVSRALRGTR